MTELDVRDLPLSEIEPSPFNPNVMDREGLERLKYELDTVGCIDPIQVVRLAEGRYRLLGGEHRWRAASELGWSTLPAVVLSDSVWQNEDLQKFVTVRLNALKGKLNPQKMAKLYTEMATKYGEEELQSMFAFCFPAGTLVETESGPRPIEDVRIGERVFSGTGELREVVGKVDELVRTRLLRIHLERVPPLLCTTGHHMFACKKNAVQTKKLKRRVWDSVTELRADELEIGDALELPALRSHGIARLSLPAEALQAQLVSDSGRYLKKIPVEYEVSEDLAWLIGLYTAQGSYSGISEICFGLNASDTDIADRVVDLLRKLFYIESKLTPAGGGLNVRCWSKVLGTALSGWCGEKAHRKHFPQALLSAERSVQAALLSGYWDGDGHTDIWTQGRHKVGTVSKGLAYQVFRLATTLGFAPSITVVPEKLPRSEYWIISWLPKPRLPRQEVNGSLVAEILEIEEIEYTGRILDLAVFEEHSYLAGLVRVGNTDKDAYLRIVKDIGKGLKKSGLGPEIAKKFEEQAKGSNPKADLGSILKHLMHKYGDTLAHGFMVFTWGGKQHTYIAITDETKAALDKLFEYCLDTGTDINDVIGPLTKAWLSNISP